mmetsp:Transcript_36585/g.79850  ORF Transcript_36585/g.79850 Transcript_36585/m.79850 type:complete len:442 (-) Transcript_36585:1351-2676(-)
MHLFDRHLQLEGLRDGPHPHRRGALELAPDLVHYLAVLTAVRQLYIEALGIKALATLVDHPQRLLDCLLKGASDRHDLANALHAGAHFGVHCREFLQVPPRHLSDAVIQGGLEASRGAECDTVPQLHKIVAQGQLRGHVGQRVPGSLGCEGATAGETCVHLDDPELLALGVHSILDIALTHDTQVPHHLQGALAQAVVLRIGQCHRGGDDNGIARVNAHGVEVLHVADGDAIVVCIPHDLILKLLPTLQALVHDNLWTVHQSHLHQLPQLALVRGEAAAQAAQGKGCPHQDGVADLGRSFHSLLHFGAASTLGHAVAALGDGLGEELAVFSGDDGLDRCAQHLHVVLGKHALLLKLDGAVQRSLAAEGAQNAIRPLPLDHLCHKLDIDGQEVDTVSIIEGSLHRRDVWVDQNRIHTALAQGLDGLAAGIVELARLADGQAP